MVLLPLISCSDDELDALRTEQEALSQRVLALETWQAQVNENIASLKKLVESLEQRDYVTGVTPLNDGSGYIISFLNNDAIIIKMELMEPMVLMAPTEKMVRMVKMVPMEQMEQMEQMGKTERMEQMAILLNCESTLRQMNGKYLPIMVSHGLPPG